MSTDDFCSTLQESFEPEIVETFHLNVFAHLITDFYNAIEDEFPEPIDIIPSTSDYLVNDFKNLLDEFDNRYTSVHKNLKKIQENDRKLNSVNIDSRDFEDLQFFVNPNDLSDEIEIDRVIEQMELMLTQKECEHASISAAAEEEAFLQEELVEQIDTLESLLVSGHVSLDEKQNKHLQMEYTEDLGILNQCSPYITLQFNLQVVSPVEDENSTPLFRGLPEKGIFDSIIMRDIKVTGYHESLVNLCQSFASALFPGAIVACFQLQSCVDMTLTEDIRRLGSLYALNWNPRSRCLHLLTDHGGTAKATIHIAPNGSVNLVTVKKLPNSDQYGSCDFIPPMSWCLDEWMMEINDFSHSDDF
uniref:Uncharacterized protein n=1 Tax=Trichobilharzia regenti TaxID=157069 RepID=A0AA85JVB1_TRIRE|nr:unnamed protein product [Trichobilharzia regenti]